VLSKNWIQKLRSHGKKIRDTTTGLGHIVWSDTDEEVSYRGLELSMTGLKEFIARQAKMAEAQLHSLLSVYEDKNWTATVPALYLNNIQDNPAISTPCWSFICDPRTLLFTATVTGYFIA
jgi:hypothetical protein